MFRLLLGISDIVPLRVTDPLRFSKEESSRDNAEEQSTPRFAEKKTQRR